MVKYAIVTGGTKGIGKGISISLLEKGYKVIVTFSKDEDAAMNFQASLREDFKKSLIIYKCDQSSSEEVYKFITFVKGLSTHLDCIVCNAGATVRKSFKDLTDIEWNKVMQVTVNSNFILIRELHNIISPGSRIVFIGSLMGIHPHSTSLVYGVSKAAMHALAVNLVKEFEHTNTTVNVIVPGFVETEWQQNKPHEIRDKIYNKTALARFAQVSEIVSAFDFCVNNAFVNGSLIEVSGGYSYR